MNHGKIQDNNIIFIGRKPFNVYELAALTALGRGKDKIELQSIGAMLNGKALDIAEILARKIGLSIEKISTQTITKEFPGEKESVKKMLTSLSITLERRLK